MTTKQRRKKALKPTAKLLRSLKHLRDQGVPFRPLKEIRRRAGNPRNNRDAVPAVIASLQEFGWTNPMLIDPRGELEAGDTRWQAAEQLGLEEVPCIELEHDERMAKLYVPADNKLGEIATWDGTLLSEMLDGFGVGEIELTGFTESEIDAMNNVIPRANPARDQTRRVDDTPLVVIECTDEDHQRAVLEEAQAKGWKCRALI